MHIRIYVRVGWKRVSELEMEPAEEDEENKVGAGRSQSPNWSSVKLHRG